MHFDVNRMARLAGLGHNNTDQGLISESAEQTQEETLSELGNQRKRDEQGDEDEHGHQLAESELSDDELIEIDADTIKEEIMKIKQERLAETRLRDVIRHELGDILEAAGYTMDGSWVYGDDQPTQSKPGQVALGTLGLGFK